jgi:FKBP-type peptidyl-prolyl cis-trans isomerase (trigger factor)
MGEQKRKITISFDIEVPEELVERKLDELAQEIATPLQKMGIKLNIEELKKVFGKQIGNLTIKSLHEKFELGKESAMGYDGKLWEKATC